MFFFYIFYLLEKGNKMCSQSGGIGDGGETSQSEWSEDDDGAASEPLLDQESTGYTTDDPALEQVSMMNDAGLTDAEGKAW